MRRGLLTISLLASTGVGSLAEPPGNPRLVERYEQMLDAHPAEGLALDRLWKIYSDAGRTDELLADYQKRQGTFSGALVYGWLLQRGGRPPDAATAFHAAAKLDPKSPSPHIALAGLLADQPAQAAVEWEQAADCAPTPDNLLALGNAWLAANDSTQAAAAWERAMQLAPQDLTLRTQLAQNYEQQHLPEKALIHYQYLAGHAEPSDRVAALQKVAQLQDSLSHPEAAETALDVALDLTAPGNWRRDSLELQLINLSQRNGRLEQLEQRWQQAITRNPRDLGAYWKIAGLYLHTAEEHKERAWLEKMAALAPDNREVQLSLARARQADGDPAAAAATLDALLQDQSADSSLVFERAGLDLQMEQPQAAVARLEALVQAHSDDQALERRVITFYRESRLISALENRLRADASRSDEAVVELARFLFDQHRTSEAGHILQGLVHPSASIADQAAAWERVAALWKEYGQLEEAGESLQQARSLEPKNVAHLFALADLQISAGRFEEARHTLSIAYDLQPGPDTDQKLFRAFQSEVVAHSAPAPDSPFIADDGAPITQSSPALRNFVAGLVRAAMHGKNTSDQLRAARWLLWTQRNDDAMRLARAVLKTGADSIEAHRLILQIATAAKDSATAQEQLEQLSILDPDHARDWQRQLAQLLLDRSNFEDGLRILDALTRKNPSDLNALTDLAVARQRADQWSDALLTWQHAYSIASPSQQREISQPLVHALEHLGLNQKAAELMLSASDAAGTPDDRKQNLDRLIAFCAAHDLTTWLRQQLDTRHRADAGDLSTTRALAALAQADDRPADALQLLSSAADQSPDDPQVLREVVRLARDLNRPQDAISRQQQLAQMAPPDDPAETITLAQMQEEAGDLAGATRTWQQIARQFPREVELLTKAADFFQRWGANDDARDILRRVRALDPGNLAALQNLAALADPPEALSCYEQILAHTTPAQPEDSLHFPDVDASQSLSVQQSYFRAIELRHGAISGATVQHLKSFWSDNDSKLTGDAASRLPAIRAMSLLLSAQGGSAALRDWLARWNTAPGVEALWAHYYSGDHPGTIRLLQTLLAQNPADVSTRQAWIWLCLRMQEYGTLSRWLSAPERRPDDSDLTLVALGRYLSDGPDDPRLTAELFPPGSHLGFLEWQTALILAGQDKLRGAVTLGRQIFAHAGTMRPYYGLQIANWQISLGDLKGAQATLRDSVYTVGSTLDDPVYPPLREYLLLLPAEQRAAFTTSYLSRWKNDPLHAANCRLLFAALSGDQAAVQAAVRALLALAPVPARNGDDYDAPHEYRYWAFVLNTGVQLQLWNLDRAARAFWQSALGDRAFISLTTDQLPGTLREIRLRLAASRILAAEPGVQTLLLNDFASDAPLDTLASLAAVLESTGCYSASLPIYEILYQHDPENQQTLRGLLNSARSSNDLDTPRDLLLSIVQRGLSNPAQIENYRSFINDAVDLLERRNESSQSRKILDQAMQVMPRDTFWIERSARLYRSAGDDDHAEDEYRRMLALEPTNSIALSVLADLLRTEGRDEELARLPAPRPPAIASAPSFGLRGSDVVRRELCANAARLATEKKLPEAIATLCSAIAKSTIPADRFTYQLALAGLLPPDHPLLKPLLQKLHDSLNDLPPGVAPDSPDTYYALLHKLNSARHPEIIQQVEADWDHGDGIPQAGLALLRWGYTADESIAPLAKAFAAKASTFDSSTLENAANLLQSHHQPEAALALRRAIVEASPSQYKTVLQFAAALHSAGHQDEAVSLLEQVAARCVFSPGIAIEVAPVFQQFGLIPQAKIYWALATASDPAAQNTALWANYTRFLSDTNDPGFLQALRKAYSNRANLDCTLLVEQSATLENFAAAPANEMALNEELSQLNLSSTQLETFWSNLFSYWVAGSKPDKALPLLKTHLEAIVGNRTSTDNLLPLAKATGAYTEITSQLEPIATQRSADLPKIPGTLAALYAAWATAEKSPELALPHLQRAAQLAPHSYAIIEQLSRACVAANQRPQAITVLHQFIAATRNVRDKSAATHLLETI